MRTVKQSYLRNLRNQAEEEFLAKLTLDANTTKELYTLADCDFKVFGSRPDMTNINVWLDQLKTFEQKAEHFKKDYDEKAALLERGTKCAEFYMFWVEYQSKHYNPTEDDYETVKMANDYGIVEDN